MFKKIILGTFIVIMLALPVILVAILSDAEKAKYKPDESFAFIETSYGVPEKFERRSLHEYDIVSGQFVSGNTLFQDLGSSPSDDIRVLVSIGDEISVGGIIGIVNGVPTKCKYNGVVREIVSKSNTKKYVVLDSTDDILLSCKLPLGTILEKDKKYKNEFDETVETTFISKQIEDSTRFYHFKVSGSKYAFGEKVTMKVYTGKTYENVLTISDKSVYQKAGEEKYFIRRVNKDGSVVGECEVIPGYEGDGYISVTGADESWYCDPAYSALVDVKGN